MGRYVKTILLLIVLFLSVIVTGVSAGEKISVEVSLDRDTIGLDEQAMLRVVVSGKSQNLPAPQLPTLPMFEMYNQGSSTNISIVNGEVTASNSYQFMIIPTKPGVFPIEQIAIVYKNKRYKGNSVNLTVLKKGSTVSEKLEDKATTSEGQSKDYFLEAEIDRKKPFVGEQVTLTLKFFIAVQYYGSPELTEPTTTGFWTEILGNKAPYYQRINNRKYKIIERKYALFPTHTGDLTIGRAAIKTTIANRNNRRRDPFDALGNFFGRGVDVTVRSNSIRVNVKALPTKGKPDNFTGSIGKFQVSAIANKSTVEIDQPVTVTVNISGTGNVKSVSEPFIPESNDFRVYRASINENVTKSNDRMGGRKIFEETFLPKRPGNLEIPAIYYNYFDPIAKKYRQISTRPIKLKVTKPEGYVASSEVPYVSPGLTIGSEARDIRYIKREIGDISDKGSIIFLSPFYLLVNGLPVILLAGMIFVRKRNDRLSANQGLARSRGASKMAKKRLSKARSMARIETVSEFYAEISLTLIAYIADKLNVSPHGLTIESIGEHLISQKADEMLSEEIKNLLQKADFARFAPASISKDDIDISLKDAEQIMTALERVSFEKT
ncbi:MAG: BatD family protein [candidate division Zixibacteria bacterium]|nr:BatD family protein [candidate division Zixibacteria bacterium]